MTMQIKQTKCLSAVNVVESSHHDLGWHKGSYDAESAFTFDEINTALDMMKEYPSFKWTHECCEYIYRYLQKYPERYEELRQRISEGRLDIGAGYTMPYTSFVTSELLVRQFIYGKKWAEKTFPGCHADIYYNTDIPGLGLQMPQLMKKAGVRYLYASRSWNFDKFHMNEYRQMESPDHSAIPVFFMHHYTDAYFAGENGTFSENEKFMQGRIRDHLSDMQTKQAGDQLPMLFCTDCLMPYDLHEQFKAWNTHAAQNNLPPMRYSTLQQALDAVFTKDINLSNDMLSGEWPNKWFYENAASDHATFMKQREASRYLYTAEILSVFRAIFSGSFRDYPSAALEEAWRAADHACHGYAPEGSIKDFKQIYQHAFDLAESLCDNAMHWLVQAVHTIPEKGVRSLIVFNNLSWMRDDFIEFSLPDGIGPNFSIQDADGHTALYQKTRSGNILLFASKIPPLGYKTYYIRMETATHIQKPHFPVGSTWTESFSNSYYTITPVSGGGALESVLDRKNQGNSLFSTEKYKIGELYDFQYDGMGAGEQLNMWQPHDGVSQISCFAPWVCIESGPVRTVFETTAEHTSRGQAVLRLIMYETVKRTDFEAELEMDETGSRQIRLMFPIQAGNMHDSDGLIDHRNTEIRYEVPFGAVRIGDEMLPKFSAWNCNQGDPNHVGGNNSDPADFTDNSAVRPREVQNWIESIDKKRNLSVLFSSYNLGWDYQDAGPSPIDTPVLQPVLISTSKSCHWLYGKWLQPGHHTFRFAMTSGTADEISGHKLAVGVNNPLLAELQTTSSGLLPESTEGIRMKGDTIHLTALKKAEDDQNHIILRYYEAEGNTSSEETAVSFSIGTVTDVQQVSLTERPAASSDFYIRDGKIIGPAAPWSIETAMISLKEIL